MPGAPGPGAVPAFVRGEALRQMQEFAPSDCVRLLEALRCWGIRDPELTDVVLERVCAVFDQLRSGDVVGLLVLSAQLGLARRRTLLRLRGLVSRHLGKFSREDLVAVLGALARLRLLEQGFADEALGALSPGLGRLSGARVSQVLFALAMADLPSRPRAARVLVAQYAQDDGPRSLAAEADAAWAICALGLGGRYQEVLRAIFARVCGASEPPREPLPLLKLHDAINQCRRGRAVRRRCGVRPGGVAGCLRGGRCPGGAAARRHPRPRRGGRLPRAAARGPRRPRAPARRPAPAAALREGGPSGGGLPRRGDRPRPGF
ncbi:unnamed protein product [Prorocentrum cordatum]|uniref:Uncharacterized protein n=1 Tax=Prorocentrum cordatum TaxID=2364126 RepID=A0ABN9YCF3_9DINO|nr:unnamed protein product [Polarella glacialis]